jgi:hypothetical protein
MHVVYGLRLPTRQSVYAFDADTNMCKDEQSNSYLLKPQAAVQCSSNYAKLPPTASPAASNRILQSFACTIITASIAGGTRYIHQDPCITLSVPKN